MTPRALLLELQKDKKGRALTTEEVDMLLRDGTWDDLCMAYICSFGTSRENALRITNRMRELQPLPA
jgi:hypothetical protein